MASAAFASGPPTEIYHYREITGKSVKRVQWQLERRGQDYALTYSAPGEQYVTITGPDYRTRSWSVSDANQKTTLTAEREGRTIVVRGRLQGRPVDRTIAIDDAPWYQATSLSLRELIASGDSECRFWTLRPGTLTAHKIRATKKDTQPDSGLPGQPPLIHIRLSLTGLLAPLWKSDYWFSLPDGVFYRFEGPSGPPGAPRTTIRRQ